MIGSTDGTTVGPVVGVSIGATDGTTVGSSVGGGVPTATGATDGAEMGSAEGLTVGSGEGSGTAPVKGPGVGLGVDSSARARVGVGVSETTVVSLEDGVEGEELENGPPPDPAEMGRETASPKDWGPPSERSFSADTRTVQMPEVTSDAGTTMRSTLFAESREQVLWSPVHSPDLKEKKAER